MKNLQKGKTFEAEVYPQEAIAEEEPRYLRRQKPIEIRRRKFGKKAWKTYFRVACIVVLVSAAAGAIFAAGDFLLASPRMALARPSQVEVSGNHFVSRSSVLEIFAPDRGRSVMRIPLAARRAQLEALPWVEHATVRRALPNRIEVDLVERTPVAFLRTGPNLFLVDSQGVILNRPLEADFHFPVVIGISSVMPRDERALRMKMFVDFLAAIRQVSPSAADSVSEIDLSNAEDLRATLAGLTSASDAVIVHFGNGDFQNKFQILLNNITQWQSAAGRIASVDLRFEHEVVVNPETPVPAGVGSLDGAKLAASANIAALARPRTAVHARHHPPAGKSSVR